jgi:hypothetical protein
MFLLDNGTLIANTQYLEQFKLKVTLLGVSFTILGSVITSEFNIPFSGTYINPLDIICLTNRRVLCPTVYKNFIMIVK